MGNELPDIVQFVADFEKASWIAMRDFYPGITVHGCSFRLNQSFFKKMGKIAGLVSAYWRHVATHHLIRRLMRLYLLQVECIYEQFLSPWSEALTLGAPYSDMVIKFCDYIERVWIKSNEWPPAVWCAFWMFIRTNDGQEGWYNRHKGSTLGS